MNYLLTGATGFIGTILVDRLLASGHSVDYLARKRSPHLDSRAAFHLWNGLDLPPLDSVPHFEAVIHLTGEPVAQRWNPEVKKRIVDSRVTGTRSLVAALAQLRSKPAVLVSASAIGYYGNRGDEILTEESAPGSGFLADVCVGWERETWQAERLGIRVAAIRIATVLGKSGGALPKMLQPFRLGLGGKFGNGQQWMSWVHVDDLVELLLFTAANPNASGPLNGSSPQPLTNAAFTEELARAIHRPALFTVPKFALGIALGEMSSFVFDSLRVLPQKTTEAGFQFRYPDLKAALRNVLS